VLVPKRTLRIFLPVVDFLSPEKELHNILIKIM
jgi:hypothetical protein